MRAQDAGGTYERALAELRAAHKVGHWIWFVFPQVAGLGHSSTSRRYAIASLAEARAYLEHPLLGARLREAAGALLALSGPTAQDILGPLDAQKLRSSMTLFMRADPAETLFVQADRAVLRRPGRYGHGGAARAGGRRRLRGLAAPAPAGGPRLTTRVVPFCTAFCTCWLFGLSFVQSSECPAWSAPPVPSCGSKASATGAGPGVAETGAATSCRRPGFPPFPRAWSLPSRSPALGRGPVAPPSPGGAVCGCSSACSAWSRSWPSERCWRCPTSANASA